MGKNTVIKDLRSNLTITYPIGASLFTSCKVLNLVGNFDENYFLYYEELDLSFRVKKVGYKIGFSNDSIVYHKQGASTNSKQDKRKRNLFVIKVSYQSLIKFYKKNIPNQIFGAYLYLLRQSISSLLKLEINRSILAFKTIFYKP
jgi:GT2 family glycosyltransferase